MTPALLREVGVALDGATWQTAQAKRRQVAVRTVQRWADGSRQVPDLRAEWLADLDAKIAELRALRRRLRS